MIVLDTNVISELVKIDLDDNVRRWMQRQPSADLYLCDIVVMEQSFGAERFVLRTGSDKYLRKLDDTVSRFQGRILGFSHADAISAGQLRAHRESTGRAMSVQDAMIAAICLSSDATLATRNTKDFAGLDLRLLNPFEEPTANH